jgi:hypothetical protein
MRRELMFVAVMVASRVMRVGDENERSGSPDALVTVRIGSHTGSDKSLADLLFRMHLQAGGSTGKVTSCASM